MVTDVIQKPIIETKEYTKKDDILQKSDEKSAIKSTDTKELDKVQKIKEMIKKGEYKIDIEATARKIAEELL